MSADQLNSLNTWVAVIAIASLVQVAALAAIALVGYRLIGESRRAIVDLEQRHLEPLARRVNEALDGMNAEVARIRRAGDRVQGAVEGLHGGVSAAASVVKSAVLPGWAVTQGVLAAVSAFRGAGQRRQARSDLVRQDGDVTRFVNEGGNDARDQELRD